MVIANGPAPRSREGEIVTLSCEITPVRSSRTGGRASFLKLSSPHPATKTATPAAAAVAIARPPMDPFATLAEPDRFARGSHAVQLELDRRPDLLGDSLHQG